MKTKILVATAVLALLATLFAVVKSGDGPEPVRLAGPAASGARVAAVEEAPGDPAARLDHAAPGGEPRPEPVADGEVESYRELRRVAPVFAACQRNTREAHALIEELGGAEEPPPPVADPVTAAYLRDLIRDYRAQQAGAERLDLLRRILETHGRYLEATHDTSFLSFLEDVCSVSDVGVERELAVPGCDDRTLDLLLRLSVHRDPAVRAAAVRALADDPRGFDAVARALGDDASTVRWTAAIELQYAATDPARIPALLDRIRAETHPLAADSMVRAICALDPENGAGRIESAVASAPDSVRDVVLKALRSPEPEGALAAPRMPPQAPEARPDAETRAYLERLVQTYRSLPQGQERLAAAERLAEAHAAYFRITEDGSFLPILGEIARGSPDVDERVAVVGSFHSAQDRRVVDLVVELKGSAEPLVRSSVAGVFAWVQGPEAPRARKELLEMLRDRAASVRIAVASLVAVLGGEGDAALLLARLGGETDVAAAYAMIEAILRLDPERGRERIAAVEANSSVIEAALRLRGERAK